MPHNSYTSKRLYDPEALLGACSAMQWNGNAGLLVPPDKFAGEMEVELHIPREDAVPLLRALLAVLYKIDAYINAGSGKFQPAIIDVYADKFIIEYYGVHVNTQFDVHLRQKGQDWYLSKMGMQAHNPPVCIVSHKD